MTFKDTPFETTHPLLGHALRAVPEDWRPPPPYHLGGPLPVLSSMAQTMIGIRCAELMRDAVVREEQQQYDEIVAAAHRLYERQEAYQRLKHHPPTVVDDATAGQLYKLARVGRDRPGLFPLAPLAIAALSARADLVGMVVKSSTQRIARFLHEAGRRAALHDFFAGLDHGIVRHECQAAVDRYAPAPAPRVERVIWRADRGNGAAGHFLFSFAGGPLGLITKLKGRWRWTAGDRDLVLATLPEEHFEAGTAAFFACGE